MAEIPPRTARIVLVKRDGRLLGALPTVQVATPWWMDIAPVVESVRNAFGIEVIVLRLLSVKSAKPFGGEVTYLAETASDPEVEPWEGTLDDHPLRLPYAEPGGPAADLMWAEAVLADKGFLRAGPAVQVRTWNLSSLWKLPVEGETIWLKSVPPFFAHEGALLRALAGGPVPELIGSEGGLILMREIPGDDGYAAPMPTLLCMLPLLFDLQKAWIGREEELLQLGLPDWRPGALIPLIQSVIAKHGRFCPKDDEVALESIADGLAMRFRLIEECGIPDTLVHGDFHPGNVRVKGEHLTLIDWGDSGLGHPLFDQSAFLDDRQEEHLEPLRLLWIQLWESAIPRSLPERAARLLAPISAARRAVVYDGFLEQIEPSEHVYHRSDPVDWLRQAAALARAEIHP
jgi:hypothetical protein